MTDKLDLILKKLGKLDELTDIVYSLRDGQEELKAQFDSLTITVAKVQGDITKMQGDITAIKEGQQRHEKILQALALRSIEQETQIREFIK